MVVRGEEEAAGEEEGVVRRGGKEKRERRRGGKVDGESPFVSSWPWRRRHSCKIGDKKTSKKKFFRPGSRSLWFRSGAFLFILEAH